MWKLSPRTASPLNNVRTTHWHIPALARRSMSWDALRKRKPTCVVPSRSTRAIRRRSIFLATLRFDQQRYDEMLELLQRLISIEPGDADTHVSMGVALFHLGRSDEALQRFDQALSLDPTLENARTNREAVLEVLKGNVE